MTSKIDNLIKLVKENNQRNNVEIISQLLALKIKFKELEEQVSVLDNQVNNLALDLDIAREENETLKASCKAIPSLAIQNEKLVKAIEILKEKFFIDLIGADLDYSCLPLWYGSLGVHFDDKQLIQILYHLLYNVQFSKYASQELKDKLLTKDLIELANKFHRNECKRLKVLEE